MGGIQAIIHKCEAPETGYWAEVPALPGCVTQGETLEEVRAMIQDAVSRWLAAAWDLAINKSHNREKYGRKVCIFLMGLVLASINSSLAQFITMQQIGVRNKHFVMIAHVAGIYNNTHRVLLDTCDTIQLSASEFKKIRTKWKVGDLVSISEWMDDKGDFVDYELEVYGKPSARGEVVDE